MDSRINEVLEFAMKENSSIASSLQPAVNAKMELTINNCFNKNGKNADKFANCLIEMNKKLQTTMKPLQFKMIYLSKFANECLVKGSSVKECQAQLSTKTKQLFEDTLKQIDKM